VKPQLPDDFRDFLRFLGDERVQYLLIGGYAVGYYGHPRTTGDMDVWIALHPDNAARVVAALHRFGFTHGEATEALFLESGNIVRMGLPPMRIEILNQIDGVEFDECYHRRETVDWDGLNVPIISLPDLLTNKRSTGRTKDQADVEALTEPGSFP
jgi:predicted nucleotidyltransferase